MDSKADASDEMTKVYEGSEGETEREREKALHLLSLYVRASPIVCSRRCCPCSCMRWLPAGSLLCKRRRQHRGLVPRSLVNTLPGQGQRSLGAEFQVRWSRRRRRSCSPLIIFARAHPHDIAHIYPLSSPSSTSPATQPALTPNATADTPLRH